MKFIHHDTLIKFQGKPDRRFYCAFLSYTVILLGGALFLAMSGKHHAGEKIYFYVDFCTAAMLVWFIEKSFRTQPLEKHVTAFRGGLFVLFNALIIIMAGALNLLSLESALLLSSLLLVPAMMLIILSFNHFIKYINVNYKSVVDLSLTDELTGLPNRRFLNMKLREWEKQPATVCVADIDHFKRINDTFGHETGDKVLTNLGLILTTFITESVFIARSGGEEFCILLSDRVETERVIHAIKAAMTLAYNDDINVTISAGIAYKRKNDPFTHVITNADEALYRAKLSGRNRIVVATDV